MKLFDELKCYALNWWSVNLWYSLQGLWNVVIVSCVRQFLMCRIVSIPSRYILVSWSSSEYLERYKVFYSIILMNFLMFFDYFIQWSSVTLTVSFVFTSYYFERGSHTASKMSLDRSRKYLVMKIVIVWPPCLESPL